MAGPFRNELVYLAVKGTERRCRPGGWLGGPRDAIVVLSLPIPKRDSGTMWVPTRPPPGRL